jgi:oligoendopeptidase F
MAVKKIPMRSEISAQDKWDLGKLYDSDELWAVDLAKFEKIAERIPSFKGTLGKSLESLANYLDFACELLVLGERLEYYSELRECEDGAACDAHDMSGRLSMASAKIAAEMAWVVPEIQAIPDDIMQGFLQDARMEKYRIYISRLMRWKPYILSEKEERVIAMQGEADGAEANFFSLLTNVDIDFGTLKTPKGEMPLSQSTFSVFMENPDRNLREAAYKQFYSHYDSHKNTLAGFYWTVVKKNAIDARIRGFPGARFNALFHDDVNETVYDNLISTINANLDPLHRYYELRRRALKLDSLRHWDVYTPIVPAAAKKTSWAEAVDEVSAALSPLGAEYVDTLRSGLLGRWADRYENKGKRSGAFSAGCYTSDPYILMNYKEDSVRDIFTLAHEGGHSMHTWYSVNSNPFMQYKYTIFEAEVASTFNEELLFRHLLQKADTKDLRLYLLNKRADDILATLYRQTMFAEYEHRTHTLEESGTPLTIDVLRREYRLLLEKYFGKAMILEEESDLECLRIPHFYNAFYVFKYATGISASLALAERVLSGGKTEKDDYFKFLKSGGSRFPMESLRVAGVDMASPDPIKAACEVFNKLVNELEKQII